MRPRSRACSTPRESQVSRSDKELAHRLVFDCLERLEPSELEDLDVVFDVAWYSARRGGLEIDSGASASSSMPPFETSLGDASLIAALTWIVSELIRHVRSRRLAALPIELAAKARELTEASRLSDAVEDLLPILQKLAEQEAPSWPSLAARRFPTLYVDADPAESRLRFLAVEGGAEHGVDAAGPRWISDPARFLGELRETIRRMSAATTDPLQARERLASLGNRLARQIVPESIMEWTRTATAAGSHLLVVSNETWVPWELLTLESPAGRQHLGEAVALSLWRHTRPTTDRLRCRSLGWVANHESSPNLHTELESMQALTARRCTIGSIGTDNLKLRQAWSCDSFDIWHFIGHFHTRGSIGEEWGFPLEPGSRLDSLDLAPDGSGGPPTGPLVVLNGCGSAAGFKSLSRLGSYADAFLEAGASAVVACRWDVADVAAAHFSRHFYGALASGESLARSVLRARCQLRELFPSDPAWLAYTVFADPSARFSSDDGHTRGDEPR